MQGSRVALGLVRSAGQQRQPACGIALARVQQRKVIAQPWLVGGERQCALEQRARLCQLLVGKQAVGLGAQHGTAQRRQGGCVVSCGAGSDLGLDPVEHAAGMVKLAELEPATRHAEQRIGIALCQRVGLEQQGAGFGAFAAVGQRQGALAAQAHLEPALESGHRVAALGPLNARQARQCRCVLVQPGPEQGAGMQSFGVVGSSLQQLVEQRTPQLRLSSIGVQACQAVARPGIVGRQLDHAFERAHRIVRLPGSDQSLGFGAQRGDARAVEHLSERCALGRRQAGEHLLDGCLLIALGQQIDQAAKGTQLERLGAQRGTVTLLRLRLQPLTRLRTRQCQRGVSVVGGDLQCVAGEPLSQFGVTALQRAFRGTNRAPDVRRPRQATPLRCIGLVQLQRARKKGLGLRMAALA